MCLLVLHNLGHLEFIWATSNCRSLAQMGHQLSTSDDFPVIEMHMVHPRSFQFDFEQVHFIPVNMIEK